MNKSLAIGSLALSLFTAGACDSSTADARGPVPTEENVSEASEPRRVTVQVTADGYTPSAVEASADAPLTLVFKRTTDQGCGKEVVFPELDIERTLPLNQEVEVELTPQTDERIAFTCGMGMYRGSVVASR